MLGLYHNYFLYPHVLPSSPWRVAVLLVLALQNRPSSNSGFAYNVYGSHLNLFFSALWTVKICCVMSQLWRKTWKSLLTEWCWLPAVLIFMPCLQVRNALVVFKKICTGLKFSFSSVINILLKKRKNRYLLFQIPVYVCFSFLLSVNMHIHWLTPFCPVCPVCPRHYVYLSFVCLPAIYSSF